MLSSTTRLGLGALTRPALKTSIAKPIATRSIFKLIPQPPGNIIDTVNEAYVPPPSDKSHGSRHWTSERIVTVFMAPLIMCPLVTGTAFPLANALLGPLLLFHTYAGFQSCITDYIPLRVYGVWHKAAMGLLAFGTAIAGYGIYVIESTEKDGLVGMCKRLWAIK